MYYWLVFKHICFELLNHPRVKRSCVGLMMLLLCTLLHAECGDTIRTFRLDTIAVEATLSTTPERASMPMQKMYGADMTRTGAQSVGDAVRHFAGVGVKDYGGLGGMKTVSVRGLSAAHTAIVYDDVVVGNCQAGQVDVGQFPASMMSSVSVAVGHEDDLNASARALASGSVLAMNSRCTDDFDASSVITIKGGSFGFVNPSLSFQHERGKDRFMLTTDYSRMDGNYPYRLVNGTQTTLERRTGNDLSSLLCEADWRHAFDSGAALHAKLFRSFSDRGLPGSVVFYNTDGHERLRNNDLFAQTVYHQPLGKRFELHARSRLTRSSDVYTDHNVKYTGGVQTDENLQTEYYAQATLRWTATDNLSFSLAQDGVVNHLTNNLPSCPFPTRLTSFTALQGLYYHPQLQVYGSLLTTAATEHVENGQAPDDRLKLTPSVSLSLQPLRRCPVHLRLLYKETYRMPSFNDMYYFRVGTRALRPEWARETGAGLTIRLLSGERRFSPSLLLTADVYRNDVKDKIVAFPTTYVWKMANFGRVEIRGIDIHASSALSAWDGLTFTVSLSYSFQRAIDVTDASNSSYGLQLPYTPVHSGSALLGAAWNGWSLDYSLVAASARYSMMIQTPLYRLEPYMEHAIGMSRALLLRHARTLRLRAEALNFTGCSYEIIRYYPMPLQQYRLTLSYEF